MINFEAHHEFIIRTDKNSLCSQIRGLVAKAIEISNRELENRRGRLQRLLEYEDKIYEAEFANKVKARLEEDIRERKTALLSIKEESKERSMQFMKEKRIQQQMEGCYEIREALRNKELKMVKICQQEQIVENERKLRRERELDKFWVEVDRVRLSKEQEQIQEEKCLRQSMNKKTTDVLDWQLQQHELKREQERQEKAAETAIIDKIIEEMRLEKVNVDKSEQQQKAMKYRKELTDMMNEKKNNELKEKCEAMQLHMEMMEAIRRAEDDEKMATFAAKRAHYEATKDYLEYVKRLRKLDEDQRNMLLHNIDELSRVDLCTKYNKQQERARRAKRAEETYAELRKQICDVAERNIREEAERREDKIIENRFVHPEVTRADILLKQREFRLGLDKQIAMLRRIRAEEQAKFSDEIKRAFDDPEMCAELAEMYINSGTDYLKPHANWLILACNNKEYARKPGKLIDPNCPDDDQKLPPCACVTGIQGNCQPNRFAHLRGDIYNSKK